MSLWRQLSRGLRGLVLRSATNRDIVDEIEQYVDDAAAAFEASGLAPEDARRAARRQLGSVTALHEQVRAYGWEHIVETTLSDIRHAARRIRRYPGHATVAALTLALGIGASTAIFSAVNPVLFQPLPYPDARQLMLIWDGQGGSRLDVTFGTYRELVARTRSFESMAVMRPVQPTLTGVAEPERLDGQYVSADFFRVLGVRPALGRDFEAADDEAFQPNGPFVAIVSDTLWRRRFGADPALVGRQILLNDVAVTVIGIMPARFENVLGPTADIWSTLKYDTTLPLNGREWGHHLRLVGRVRADLDPESAAQELDAIARTTLAEYPRPQWASLQDGFIANPLQDELTRSVRPAVIAVAGAVILLLTIACVNVTNLLLARGAQRRGEFAVRAALGAGRTRLIRQLLTESLLLSLIGGVLGMAVAETGVRALTAISPPGLPRASAIAFDATVFAFGVGISTLIGVVVGLIPALHVSRNNLNTGLRESSRQTAGGSQMTRRTLVVAEVALALVLLVSAGLLLRSLQRLFAISPGFNATNLITMEVQVSGRRFDQEASDRFFSQALDAVRQTPGVVGAAFNSQLPLGGGLDEYGVHFSDDDPNVGYPAFRYSVSPGYFEMMGIPLRRGRLLDGHDAADAPMAVLLSESLWKTKFADRDPIGQLVKLGPADGPWHTVVGVVGDVKQASLAAAQSDAFYTTPDHWRFGDNVRSLVLRSVGDPAAIIPEVKQAIWSIDKDQAITRVATMDALLAATAAERRFAMILFAVATQRNGWGALL